MPDQAIERDGIFTEHVRLHGPGHNELVDVIARLAAGITDNEQLRRGVLPGAFSEPVAVQSGLAEPPPEGTGASAAQRAACQAPHVCPVTHVT